MARSIATQFIVVPFVSGPLTCVSSDPTVLSVVSINGLLVNVHGSKAGVATLSISVAPKDGSPHYTVSVPCTLTNNPHNLTGLILTTGQPVMS
jgi:hypothetical protein